MGGEVEGPLCWPWKYGGASKQAATRTFVRCSWRPGAELGGAGSPCAPSAAHSALGWFGLIMFLPFPPPLSPLGPGSLPIGMLGGSGPALRAPQRPPCTTARPAPLLV